MCLNSTYGTKYKKFSYSTLRIITARCTLFVHQNPICIRIMCGLDSPKGLEGRVLAYELGMNLVRHCQLQKSSLIIFP